MRFVLLMHATWDHHTEINNLLPKQTEATDQPAAALIKDLKQRGMLDEMLVVWGGEFGRTPMSELHRPEEAGNAGRDHHPDAFNMRLAGGGIRGRQVIGRTSALGLSIEEDPIHTHDLQATILHCLGLDHTRLTYRNLGRAFRLTDVSGEVVKTMLV